MSTNRTPGARVLSLSTGRVLRGRRNASPHDASRRAAVLRGSNTFQILALEEPKAFEDLAQVAALILAKRERERASGSGRP
jgi:hypothetical protein